MIVCIPWVKPIVSCLVLDQWIPCTICSALLTSTGEHIPNRWHANSSLVFRCARLTNTFINGPSRKRTLVHQRNHLTVKQFLQCSSGACPASLPCVWKTYCSSLVIPSSSSIETLAVCFWVCLPYSSEKPNLDQLHISIKINWKADKCLDKLHGTFELFEYIYGPEKREHA